MNGEILTGNELNSGATVYLAANGEWVKQIDKARVFGPDEAEARDATMLKATENHRLLGLEIEKVSVEGGRVVAERLRESMRAEGPTAPRFEPQELGEDEHVSL
ncbi:MAG: DUF2849 domain-containing protein [Cucumibacter sp.]